MRIRNTSHLFGVLFFLLSISATSVAAPGIQPAGKAVATDDQGNTIYQVASNGIEIGYKLIGTGEPLLMIIGLGDTMEHWPLQITQMLSERYQLIILDNRGMGHTTINDDKFSYQLFADDVMGLLAALGVEKTNVLGYSMGSVITQKLLLEYPETFNKAIIHATSVNGSAVAEAFKGKTSPNPTINRQVAATVDWKTPIEQVASVTNQVMFIVGTSDQIVGVESSKTLANAIPGAWLVQFKNGTHRLINQAPVEFAKIVLTFLNINETVETN